MSSRSRLPALLIAACLAAAPSSDSEAAQGRGKSGERGTAAARGRALNRQTPPQRQLPPSRQEPAFARGYDDGYQDGSGDGRQGLRYDPADSRQYRDGSDGYVSAYGSRDAYRNNYRAGFRQGYEAGYRDATR